MPQSPNKTLEDVVIAFRNFSGKEDMYNRAGDRNFSILLNEETAQDMERDGWNIKRLKPRDADEVPQPYIQVAVSYKTRPPKIMLITSRGKTYLSEDEVEMLDWVDIQEVDVTLNPYEWAVGDKHGVKAYLKTMVIVIEEDYLEMKWDSIIETRQQQIGPANDYIDGEIVEDYAQIEGAR